MGREVRELSRMFRYDYFSGYWIKKSICEKALTLVPSGGERSTIIATSIMSHYLEITNSGFLPIHLFIAIPYYPTIGPTA